MLFVIMTRFLKLAVIDILHQIIILCIIGYLVVLLTYTY